MWLPKVECKGEKELAEGGQRYKHPVIRKMLSNRGAMHTINITNIGTVHALITWLSCTDHVTAHALMRWLFGH